MTKKSFKDNPALQFISPRPPLPEAAEADGGPSRPGESPVKPNPLYLETRSRRVQLLMRPSLQARLKRQAAQRGQSLNDLIHSVLTQWLDSLE